MDLMFKGYQYGQWLDFKAEIEDLKIAVMIKVFKTGITLISHQDSAKRYQPGDYLKLRLISFC